jgi:CheY-like chemotaxis protein
MMNNKKQEDESALRRAVYRHHFRVRPILMIDDSEDDRNLFLRLVKPLVSPTHPVVTLEGGKALFDYLDNFEKSSVDAEEFEREIPGMIFLDLMMPGMNGLEVLHSLRQNPLWHTIPVTILTHSHDDSSIEKALEMGANAFLSKPFTKLDLMKAIKKTNNFSAIDI